MDTIAGLIDKLVTVRLKRGVPLLPPGTVRDLDNQIDKLVQEIDAKFSEMLATARTGATLDNGANVQRKHKTY